MSVTTIPDAGVPIASVEQSTGIARATLRIWERRYGFPQPGRDHRGERSYPDEQVHKLRLIADLMGRGHRPGRLVQLTAAQLGALSTPAGERPGTAARSGTGALADPILQSLRNHDVAGLVLLLQHSIRTMGLAGFIMERMPQMNFSVGVAWARGELEVYEEHLYTEVVQQVVRSALPAVPGTPGAQPRLLLATLAEEPHGLGLLMAHAVAAVEGCSCTSLGVRVPAAQVVSAATAFRADVVGLSFTGSMNPTHVMRGLEQLRAELPPQVAIWAGGGSPVLARHKIPGVLRVPHIGELPAMVAQWRALHLDPA